MEQKEKAVKIANIIKEALAKHPEFGLVMPVVYNPTSMEPTVPIMINTDEGSRLGFTINISDLSLAPHKD